MFVDQISFFTDYHAFSSSSRSLSFPSFSAVIVFLVVSAYISSRLPIYGPSQINRKAVGKIGKNPDSRLPLPFISTLRRVSLHPTICLFFLSLIFASFLRCACDAGSAHLFSNRPTKYLPNYCGGWIPAGALPLLGRGTFARRGHRIAFEEILQLLRSSNSFSFVVSPFRLRGFFSVLTFLENLPRAICAFGYRFFFPIALLTLLLTINIQVNFFHEICKDR